MGKLVEPILSAHRGALAKAQGHLRSQGIESRYTKPRREEGLLKVSREDAERARRALQQFAHGGRILSQAEASWFFCPACGHPLSLGASHCDSCGFFVGDAHGM